MSILFAALCAVLTTMDAGRAQSRDLAKGATILVFGDSLSAGFGLPGRQGWVTLLEARLSRIGKAARVVNLSESSQTAAGSLRRFTAAVDTYQPHIVIIELGAVDGLSHFETGAIYRDIGALIASASVRHAKVLLVGMRIPNYHGDLYADQFSAIYRDLARNFDVLLVDFLLAGVAANPQLMQLDGLHPNQAGQTRLLENVWTVLGPLLDSL